MRSRLVLLKSLFLLPALTLFCSQGMAAGKDSADLIVYPTDAFVGGISLNHPSDSLFEAGDYATIIDHYYNAADKTSVYELIGALYALGSPIESYKQLLAEVYYYNNSLYGNAAAAFRHANNDAEAWLFYLSFPKNKKLVDSLILDVYQQENVTAPQYGQKLFRYLIDDQYSRMLWNHAHPFLGNRKAVMSTAKDSIVYFQSLQHNSDLIFKLYQTAGHIFSKEEVGSIYDYQFLLLTHEKDSARRAYYLELLKDAVSKNICSSYHIINFIVRTEYLKKPKDKSYFFSHVQQLVDSLKIQYHQPDYVLGVY